MISLKNRLLILAVLLLTSGCYGELKGKVVDAETGKPIEGAVAMAEWTKTKGLGLTYTESVKVVETVSDKDGNIVIEGCWCPFANEPSLTIYKKSYVAWNNELLFPGYKVREGFDWKSGQMFNMAKFKRLYSYDAHVSFLRSSIRSSQAFEEKGNIFNAFKWERTLAREERKKK